MSSDGRPRVYTASKPWHARKWRNMRMEHRDVCFTARWIDFMSTIPDDAHNARETWPWSLEDVANSDGLIVYAEPNDRLMGALVEAGCALGQGKPVVVVGDHMDYNTWQYHPLVVRKPSLLTAFRYAVAHWSHPPTWYVRRNHNANR